MFFFWFWFCNYTQAIYILVGKLSYSRDFLISLANCAESRRKPEFLPEYSIVLTKAVSMELVFLKNDCSTVLNYVTNCLNREMQNT